MGDKVSHLQMIQSVIGRLALNSFQVKGWSVVLVSAWFALASKDSAPTLVYVAYLPAVVFWALDGYFLWQERLFRRLYDRVRAASGATDFSMDTLPNESGAPTWRSSVLSRTVLPLHGVVVAAVLAATIVFNTSHVGRR